MKSLCCKKPSFRALAIFVFLFFIFSIRAAQTGVSDEKEKVRLFGESMMRALFDAECSQFEKMLSEPFYFLSHGDIPRATYAEFICDDFHSVMRKHLEEKFTFEDYKRSYYFDVYHSGEFGEIIDTNGEKINLKEIFAKAPEPFAPGSNDYLFIGGRLKEGAAHPPWINFGWAVYLIRIHPDGKLEAVGVLD